MRAYWLRLPAFRPERQTEPNGAGYLMNKKTCHMCGAATEKMREVEPEYAICRAFVAAAKSMTAQDFSNHGKRSAQMILALNEDGYEIVYKGQSDGL